MSRSVGTAVENTFVRGIVTEFSGFNFPENACVDADNCEFTEKGEVIRRLGFRLEDSFAFFAYTFDPALDRVNEFFWKTPGGQGEIAFVVVQLGTTLHFYKLGATNLSSNKNSFTYNLDLVKAPGAPTTRNQDCRFTAGSEVLVVTHPYCDPIEFTYVPLTDTFASRQIVVKVRDLKLLNPNETAGNRPATVTASQRYDRYNMGWTLGTMDHPSSAVPTPTGGSLGFTYVNRQLVYPSLSELPWYYKNLQYSGLRYAWYSGDDLAQREIGVTFAPRGRFVLEAFNQDRSAISGVPGIPTITSGFQRPTAAVFLGSRLFVGGVATQGFSNKVYFSQIITDVKNNYDFYQKGDPTSELSFELLPNDGGEITILEAGRIVQLAVIKNALMVFTTNGVWSIQGSEGVGFKANDFSVERVSDIAVYNPLSFVTVESFPLWWAQDAIYTIEGEGGSLKAKNLTSQTIQSLYDEIPQACKATAKGVYNRLTQEVSWLYSDQEATPRVYNRVLVLNIKTQGFYTYSVSNGASVVGHVVISGLRSNTRPVDPTNKQLVFYNSNSLFTFGEMNKGTYQDWSDLIPTNYVSTFTTGYRIRGELQRKANSMWLSVVSKSDADSSCNVGLMSDYTNTGDTGKWSNFQQAIRNDEDRDYVIRKLKMRGTGKVNQFKFTSEGNKPFNIIGWVAHESVADRV
jgi:hypothetical protein